MDIWRWEHKRKVSVDQYGTATYEVVVTDKLEAADSNSAKAKATRLVNKHDPTVKAYPDKWKSAWHPAIEQFASARDMHFTAFTKRPFYPGIDISQFQDPDWMEELRIEKL